jgi:hypothetical protein
VIAAILNNFSAVESSLETMKDSAGSADREMGIIEQSLEYKINKLKETGVGVFQNLFQRKDLGIVIDALTGVLNAIDGITGSIGFLGTALATIGIVKFIKNLD